MADVIEELRRQIQEQLQNIKEAGMTVAVIAAKLEVKTATVYQLLDGKTTPTAKLEIARNAQILFRVDGHKIGVIDFPAKTQPTPATEIQLGLFEVTASSEGDNLNVAIKKGPQLAIELGVRLAR